MNKYMQKLSGDIAELSEDAQALISATADISGEKVAEEILTEEEEQTRVARNRILVAKSPPPPADLPERIQRLHQAVNAVDRPGIRRILRELLPSYRATENPPGAVVLPLRQTKTDSFRMS